MKTRKLALVALVLSFVAVSAFAGPFDAKNAEITIKGTVPAVFQFTVTPEADAQALDLSADLVNKKIATAYEKSNYRGSYKVVVSSQKGWVLDGLDASNPDSISYQLKYGSVAVPTTNSTATIKSGVGRTDKSGTNSDLTITTGMNSSLLYYNDTYEDVLTFTMSVEQ